MQADAKVGTANNLGIIVDIEPDRFDIDLTSPCFDVPLLKDPQIVIFLRTFASDYHLYAGECKLLRDLSKGLHFLVQDVKSLDENHEIFVRGVTRR